MATVRLAWLTSRTCRNSNLSDLVTDTSSPLPASKGRIFARRLTSTVVLWTVLLTAIFAGNEGIRQGVFLALMLLLTWTGLSEFYAMAEKRGLACFKRWGLFSGLLLLAGTFLHVTQYQPQSATAGYPSKVGDFESGLMVVFVLGLCLREFLSKSKQGVAFTAMGITLLGWVYVPWLLNFIQKIQFFPGIEGRYYVLYFILVTKFSDLGAYCTGSLIGKHKMIPRISPGKTWEGFAGALVIATGASMLFAWIAGDRLAGMTWVHAAVLGFILAAAAVVGDLIESLFKREAGVKDSGRFFPGIGGILDLLDSLLFNAPIMYLYLRHVLTS